MKVVAALLLAGTLSGCVSAGLNNPHADSEAAPSPQSGPALCQDGSPPPCPHRS
jgi:hypothetical protein